MAWIPLRSDSAQWRSRGRCAPSAAERLEGYGGGGLIGLVLPVLAGGDDAAEAIRPRDDDGPGRAVIGRQHFEHRARAREGSRRLRLVELAAECLDHIGMRA